MHRLPIDHPGCGLTVLRIVSAGGPIDDVFDQDGKLVGAYASSDTGPYACPSNASLTAHHMPAAGGELSGRRMRYVRLACVLYPGRGGVN